MGMVSKLRGRHFEQTIDNVNIHRLAVAQEQLADFATSTLYTDESSKFGKQYMVYATTTTTADHTCNSRAWTQGNTQQIC